MKKSVSKAFIALISTIVLGSCSSLGSASSLAGQVYTVTFYDDASTPNIIGYNYVIEGKALVGPTNVDYSVSKAPIDWAKDNIGCYRIFDKWTGKYLDNTDVDINHIMGDCSVYATYQTSVYDIGVYFKNGGSSLIDSQWLHFGNAFAWPVGTPQQANVEYYYDSSYLGFSLSGDTANHVIIGQSDIAYSWGAGAPVSPTPSDKGRLYLDYEPVNSKGLQTYPTYVSNGSSWFLLGNLQDHSAKLTFDATYSETYKSFNVNVFGTEAEAESGVSTSLDSLVIPYSNALSYTISGTATTFSFIGSSGVVENHAINLASVPTSWKGVYSGNGVDRVDGEVVDLNHIIGKAYFYPVF